MKRQLTLLFVVLVIIIACFTSCNNGTQSDHTEDFPASATVPGNEPKEKTANLGYSYYPKMKRGETKIIRAYVSINNPEGRIRDTLRKIEKIQTIQEPGIDTSTINIINSIPFYKKISISIDSTKDFIVKAFRPASQTIDTLKGNLWLWQITPLTDKSVGVITILVDAETPQGVLENIDIRAIEVKIEIDNKTFLRAAINYLGDNPKVSIPIIVGLVTFIGWMIKYFLEKKKNRSV